MTLVPLSKVLFELSLEARNPLKQTRLLHHEAVSLHRGFRLSLARLRSQRIDLPFTLFTQLRIPLMILNNGAHSIVLSIPREKLVLTPVKRLSQPSKFLVFCVGFSLEFLFLGCKLGDFFLEKVDFVGGLLAEVLVGSTDLIKLVVHSLQLNFKGLTLLLHRTQVFCSILGNSLCLSELSF